jgi:alanine-synthesizing transaminase
MFSRRTEWNFARNRLTVAHQQALASGRKILDLTISNPTRVGLEYKQSRILEALGDRRGLDYNPQPKGLGSARQAVAEYYRSASTAIDPESLILTTSTSEAYSYVFRLLANPGEEILFPKPSYPLFEFLADLEDVSIVPYALFYDHGWQIDLDSLARAFTKKTRAVVVVHPNNPTGSYVSQRERQHLYALCQKQHSALIVDEVFLDYSHGAKPEASFASNREVLTFTLSGISKISALPQMKLAWVGLSGPEAELRTAIARLELIADTYLSLNTPVQLAAPVLLEERKTVQPQLMARIHASIGELDRQLARHPSCSRLEVQAGWYVVLRIPVTRSDEDFAIELLKRHSVLVHPGHFYDFASEGHLVLSLIAPPEDFREGVVRLLDLANEG